MSLPCAVLCCCFILFGCTPCISAIAIVYSHYYYYCMQIYNIKQKKYLSYIINHFFHVDVHCMVLVTTT